MLGLRFRRGNCSLHARASVFFGSSFYFHDRKYVCYSQATVTGDLYVLIRCVCKDVLKFLLLLYYIWHR